MRRECGFCALVDIGLLFAGSAAIVEEDLSVSPCLILVGDDVVLEIADLLAFPEGGSLSAGVPQLERRFVFEHLVRAYAGPALDRLCRSFPGLSNYVQPGQLQ